MGRQGILTAALLLILGVGALAAAAMAQNVPSEALLFHRFKINQKHRTVARITNLGSSTSVATVLLGETLSGIAARLR